VPRLAEQDRAGCLQPDRERGQQQERRQQRQRQAGAQEVEHALRHALPRA
jgi:hypothetical protein